MPLPKIEVPNYSLKLLSTGKTILYRPFLVKEEKILLIAMESEDPNETMGAIQKIIENCVSDDSEINIPELPVFDLEHLFLKIRSKSVGETSELNIPCPECGEANQYTVDLDSIGITTDENHENKFLITDDIGVIMKYPTANLLSSISVTEETESVDQSIDMLTLCIESVFQGNKEHDFEDYTKEERTNFVEQLTSQQIAKIQNFFVTMPALEHLIDFKCSACGIEDIIPIRGLQNFFS